MKNYLKKFAEKVPAWILNHRKGVKICMHDVRNSRIVYYPGSGTDGQPVHTFVQAHAAHVFMYVDYSLPREQIKEELSERGFKGYHLLDSIELTEKDLTPNNWIPHCHPDQSQIESMRHFASVENYACLVIFERDADRDESHGAARFAVIFLGGDGIATYDAIFCNKYATAPFCLVLQDHGYGGNWNIFGKSGLMEQAARNAGVFPKFILAATNSGGTEIWNGYARIPGIPGVLGGQNHCIRELFEQI